MSSACAITAVVISAPCSYNLLARRKNTEHGLCRYTPAFAAAAMATATIATAAAPWRRDEFRPPRLVAFVAAAQVTAQGPL